MLKILTLTWNGIDKLKELRVGLLKNLEGEDWIWRIRSNGCQDGTVGEVRGWGGVEVLEVNNNRSNFSQGVNSLATDIKDTDTILLLNNDVVFADPSDLKKMKKLLERPEVGVVGARLLFKGTNTIQHNGVAFSSTRWGRMPWHLGTGEPMATQSKENRYFQAVTAACCMVKGAVWNQLKGLDERYNWSFEDIDFCLRANYITKIVCCGSTGIQHEESATLKKNPVNKLFMGKNVLVFKQTWWKDGVPLYRLDYEDYERNKSFNSV